MCITFNFQSLFATTSASEPFGPYLGGPGIGMGMGGAGCVVGQGGHVKLPPQSLHIQQQQQQQAMAGKQGIYYGHTLLCGWLRAVVILVHHRHGDICCGWWYIFAMVTCVCYVQRCHGH